MFFLWQPKKSGHRDWQIGIFITRGFTPVKLAFGSLVHISNDSIATLMITLLVIGSQADEVCTL
jgi:hypothetical protein